MTDTTVAAHPSTPPKYNGRWQPGNPGRPPGKTLALYQNLRGRITKAMKVRYGIDDYDPVIALAEIACDPSNPLDTRAAAHARIAQYLYPALKQVEVSGPGGGPIETKNLVVDALLGAFTSGQLQLSPELLTMFTPPPTINQQPVDVTPSTEANTSAQSLSEKEKTK